MADCMPKEQKEVMDKIIAHVIDATNATEQEAYEFALRCWQLNYARVKETVVEIIDAIDEATFHKEFTNNESHDYIEGFIDAVSWFAGAIDEIAKTKYGINGTSIIKVKEAD